MEIIEITNNTVFNYFASIPLWLSIPLVVSVTIISILRN